MPARPADSAETTAPTCIPDTQSEEDEALVIEVAHQERLRIREAARAGAQTLVMEARVRNSVVEAISSLSQRLHAADSAEDAATLAAALCGLSFSWRSLTRARAREAGAGKGDDEDEQEEDAGDERDGRGREE